jgi:hypothetical protein
MNAHEGGAVADSIRARLLQDRVRVCAGAVVLLSALAVPFVSVLVLVQLERIHNEHIQDDGRIVRSGFSGNESTGTRIAEDGSVLMEGIFLDTPTGDRFRK